MSLKKLLKRVLPVVVLKKAFLIYNTFRIKTVDKIIFPEYNVDDEHFILKRTGFPVRGVTFETKYLDPQVKHYMEKWDGWSDLEYVLVSKVPCVVEPDFGWALVNGRSLNYFSLGLSRTNHQRKPSIRKLLARKNKIHIDAAISLRDTGEENYFHFYNDILTKLLLLEETLPETIKVPIIISRKLYYKAFFQFYLENSPLRHRRWIVQDQQYISVTKLYLCKPITHRKEYFDKIISWLPTSVKHDNRTKDRKIFLVRSPRRLRFIENLDELKPICESYGFEVIDADELSIQEQIFIFSNTSHLIAAHGAGLTNMIYRDGRKMSILELFPPAEEGYLPYHYMLMARQYGFEYNAIIGNKGKRKLAGGFYVKPEELAQHLANILNISSVTST